MSLPMIAPDLKSRTLIVNGVSKTYAMTGWRIGYGAGPLPLIKAITLLLSQSISCPTTFSQDAAVVALEGPQDCVRDAVSTFAERRDKMLDLLNDIPGFECSAPGGSFYTFPCIDGLLGATTPTGTVLSTDRDVVMYLLDTASVATLDGSAYGAPGHLRLSFATSMEQLTAGCLAIKRAVEACTFPSKTTLETHHA